MKNLEAQKYRQDEKIKDEVFKLFGPKRVNCNYQTYIACCEVYDFILNGGIIPPLSPKRKEKVEKMRQEVVASNL